MKKDHRRFTREEKKLYCFFNLHLDDDHIASSSNMRQSKQQSTDVDVNDGTRQRSNVLPSQGNKKGHGTYLLIMWPRPALSDPGH
ncbi:hypothetical protein T4D_12153 [Trichinella pseudospiralis]|uniref:Uncharacterized protein n=1 Tax=Trichinella pseudospiralis TaxID=6337 RepID=A0A0V1FYI7_TRIPS|nr:hypothetical protein T4D_12153 [Trichinella pseudospiralis]